MSEHLPTCAQLEKRPCPAGTSLHGEPPTEHWWSGWPGAYCMKCGDEDKDEVCMGQCECPCHDAFYAEYEEWCRKQSGYDEYLGDLPQPTLRIPDPRAPDVWS